ncbi:hypothetical protein [Dokdonella soli]|uniref:DUF2339 domain-containing protein n=1 Tax=Dokdonella soli TaxID=529810 RepID=A0ABN1IFV1_9GAMM
MARWIMLGFTILGFVLVFSAKAPGLLAIGLLLALIGVIGFVLALASDRISANARPDASMASTEDLVALRKRPQRPSPTVTPSAAGASAAATPGDHEPRPTH